VANEEQAALSSQRLQARVDAFRVRQAGAIRLIELNRAQSSRP
jgi:hypothetical protein